MLPCGIPYCIHVIYVWFGTVYNNTLFHIKKVTINHFNVCTSIWQYNVYVFKQRLYCTILIYIYNQKKKKKVEDRLVCPLEYGLNIYKNAKIAVVIFII